MKRIVILIMIWMMALVFIPTPAYATGESVFIERIDAAVKKVKADYPDANIQLHEAHWVTDTTDPSAEDKGTLDVVFEYNGPITLIIEGGEAGLKDAELIPGEWEDKVIKWPEEKDKIIEFSMAKEKLDSYLGGHDCKGKESSTPCQFSYQSVSLENPDKDSLDPYFIFGGPNPDTPGINDNGLYFLVNAINGVVTLEPDFITPKPDASGRNAIRVRLGTQCISRIAPKFSGGRWVKEGNIFCDKNGQSQMRNVSETRCFSRRPNRISEKGYVNRFGISCQEEPPNLGKP